MRLLIAEDELDLAEALTAFFEKNQFSVDAVNDGLSAYEYASSDAYDAIILDVMMPKLSGVQVLERLRQEGIKVGMIRPITLWPFPTEIFAKAAKTAKAFLTVEMSMGQMVDDVKIAVNGRGNVHFYGRTGGVVPTPNEILAEIEKIAGGDR